jgi:plasmid stabilization system protein ParE
MGFKVLIADSALADLKEIVEFVAHDDPAAAVRLGEKLIECALSLQMMAARFSFHDQERGIRKMTVPPYLIFYRSDESTMSVSILHFWHGARRSPQFSG